MIFLVTAVGGFDEVETGSLCVPCKQNPCYSVAVEIVQTERKRLKVECAGLQKSGLVLHSRAVEIMKTMKSQEEPKIEGEMSSSRGGTIWSVRSIGVWSGSGPGRVRVRSGQHSDSRETSQRSGETWSSQFSPRLPSIHRQGVGKEHQLPSLPPLPASPRGVRPMQNVLNTWN